MNFFDVFLATSKTINFLLYLANFKVKVGSWLWIRMKNLNMTLKMELCVHILVSAMNILAPVPCNIQNDQFFTWSCRKVVSEMGQLVINKKKNSNISQIIEFCQHIMVTVMNFFGVFSLQHPKASTLCLRDDPTEGREFLAPSDDELLPRVCAAKEFFFVFHGHSITVWT
jgi:hypothetical protein